MTKAVNLARPRAAGSVLAAALALGGLGSIALSGAASAQSATLYVSTQAKASNADASCQSAKYTSIDAAIAAAAANATVVVCGGTYAEQVVLTKPLVLKGVSATVMAFGHDTGITIPASGSTVEGFIVKGATGEGILAVGKPGAPVEHVTIRGNTVLGNDLGNPTGGPVSKSGYLQCNATPAPGGIAIPGDCGQGIHLMGAEHSLVVGNTVVDNDGGILLTDETGPTAHNTIIHNVVENNELDCGIVLASHSPKGFADGKAVPGAGGVYDNVVVSNLVTGNGVSGQGSGILLATPLPGGAVYSNTVKHNTIAGNGQAGITLHSHTPNQDLNGNVFAYNTIGTNNLDGDFDFAPHIDVAPTGIVVASAVSTVAVTIRGNVITGDVYGIWHTGPVTMDLAGGNNYRHVGTSVFAG